MALLLCCPCGYPLDCEQLELVVTFQCPKCGRDIQIELSDSQRGRYRALLTVMDGPYWVGERFVLPVGQDLIIGTSGNCWLSLESNTLAMEHCRLKLTQRGAVQIEDLQTEAGTWIGQLRISTGKLKPTDSLTLGEYRLRLDLQDVIGGGIVSNKLAVEDTSGVLPDLRAVDGARTFIDRLVSNRFGIGRELIVLFAWFCAVYHVFALHAPPIGWEWYWTVIAGASLMTPLLIAGRKVALVHRLYKFAAIGVLVVIGVVDVAAWALPLPAIGALVLGATMPLLTAEESSPAKAVTGVVIGGLSVGYMGIVALLAVAGGINV